MRNDSTAEAAEGEAPALRRGLALLRALAMREDGASMSELAETVPMPRATAYRLMRALTDEGFAATAPDASGRYVLGPAVDALRGRSAQRTLEDAAAPVMDALAASLGETVKLVVRDRLEALTVAVSIPARDSCIASRVGTRLPLHVGASQRLLLAHAPPDVRATVLDGPLARHTPRTIVSRARLARDLDALATRRTFASHGEGVDGVGAAAALVGSAGSEPRAALVVVYVFGNRSGSHRAAILRQAAQAATAITAAL